VFSRTRARPSMLQWIAVGANAYFAPVGDDSSAPGTTNWPSFASSGYAFETVRLSDSVQQPPGRNPNSDRIVKSAWTRQSERRNVDAHSIANLDGRQIWPSWVTPSASAVAKLIKAALSQVSLLIGSGTSCNQELLIKRPSQRANSE